MFHRGIVLTVLILMIAIMYMVHPHILPYIYKMMGKDAESPKFDWKEVMERGKIASPFLAFSFFVLAIQECPKNPKCAAVESYPQQMSQMPQEQMYEENQSY